MGERGYAVGLLREVAFGDDIVEYLNRIDETLAPYDGRFLIHGGRPDVREGDWGADLVVIEFPDYESAVAWFESPAYQRIAPLRAENSESTIALIRGAGDAHKATDVLVEIG